MKIFLKDFLWQTLNHAGGRLAVFLLILYYGRLLGVAEFGILQVMLSVQGILIALYDGGANALLVKDTAVRGGISRRAVLGRLKWLAAALCMTAAAAPFLTGIMDARRWALVAVSAAALSLVDMCAFAARGLHMPKRESAINLAQKLSAALAAVAAVWIIGASPDSFVAANVAGAVCAVGIALFLFKRSGPIFSADVAPAFGPGAAAWLLIVDLGSWVYFRVDMLILKETSDLHETGLYGAAYTLFMGLALGSNAIMAVIFPRAAAAKTAAERKKWILRGAALLAGASALSIALVVPFSQRIIELVYGARYDGAAALLTGLALVTVVMFPNNLLNGLLVLAGKQRAYAAVVITAAVFNVLANLYAIPRWRAVGAVWTTALTEALLFAGVSMLAIKYRREIIHAHSG
jgi:O-antigen/teichoic acid export membrane protein